MSDIRELEKKLGYTFKDINLLKTALTHPSCLNEKKEECFRSNQRLEFLGDSVLSIAVSEYIFLKHRGFPEGKLSKLRAMVVCEDSLADAARALNLGSYLIMGHGEALSGGAERPSAIADAFEAVIAAIYLDGGFESAKGFVLDKLSAKTDEFATGRYIHSGKTMLQELVQTNGGTVTYKLIRESGPDHAKHFESAVYINGKETARGFGSSKKRSEQDAALKAIKTFKNQ